MNKVEIATAKVEPDITAEGYIWKMDTYVEENCLICSDKTPSNRCALLGY
jgi:hypothetical protein